jgi:branched-subunit amino acid ABC-type transport system permease component
MDMVLAQHLLNWLVQGSIIALVALGFSLLFGVLNVIHFSHGDVSIVGAFVALAVMQILLVEVLPPTGTSALVLAAFVAIIATGFLGVLLDWLVIRRFRTAPAMMALVATVALGAVLREMIRMFYPQGSNPKPFPELMRVRFDFGELTVPASSLFMVAVSVLMVASLYGIMHRTSLGLRIRAVAQDLDTARLMGIRPSLMFAATFFIASAVGAIGGIFHASNAGVVRFDFGIQLGLIGFSAAVIGGLGSMHGAIIGSLVLAGIDTLVQATITDGAAYRLVFAFLLVILVLVLKPSGLFGKPVYEKV